MLKKPREQIDISILYNTINDIRKNPSKYQNILSQHLSYINSLNNEFNLPNKPKIILKEGVQALKEAITFLETLKPMSSLRINFGLVMFAQYVLGDRLKNQNKMKLNISNEKFKKYGSFDLLEEIVFADTFLNYTDNYDEIVILNLLVCDGEPKRIFRNAIFSREYIFLTSPHLRIQSLPRAGEEILHREIPMPHQFHQCHSLRRSEYQHPNRLHKGLLLLECSVSLKFY